MVGLPLTVSHQLRASARILDAELSKIVRQARLLMTEIFGSSVLVAVNKGMVRKSEGNCFSCEENGITVMLA